MENILVLLVIGFILSGAVYKVIKDRKNGVKCSGCPQSKVCSAEESGSQPLKGSNIQLIKKV